MMAKLRPISCLCCKRRW